MAWHLPSLNAVRSFEAAARHQSFTLAATDLHVTPGAISRQIKSLESTLLVRLFTRQKSEVRLTPEGKDYFKAITDALQLIDGATRRLCDAPGQHPLRVTCSVLFAMRWLFPHLSRFHPERTELQLSLPTVLMPPGTEFDSHQCDAVIRLDNGKRGPKIACHCLFESELVAMCSPKLIANGPPLRRPDDLRHHRLLCSALRAEAWSKWLGAARLSNIDVARATMFESSTLAYQAAIDGLGVAIGERALIDDDLAHGRLIVPFEISYAGTDAFYLLYPRQAESAANLREFRDWIVKEARAVRAEATKHAEHRRPSSYRAPPRRTVPAARE
jgi:LysR family transcriptional regulator, glycine cleavage system transcriptional activator